MAAANQSGGTGASARPGGPARWVSLAVLSCLGAIAIGVLLKQSQFNPAVLVISQPAGPAQSAAGPTARSIGGGANWLTPEFRTLSPAERFTPDNLYDKIDGKADLYLSAGLVAMRCQRLALEKAPEQWLEWFEYDMGSLAHAFAVFSMQRRAEGQALALAPYAYRTQNALYFVCGHKYVEALGSGEDERLMKAMLDLAERYLTQSGAASERLAGLEHFPAEDLVPGSQTLQVADAFGFEQLSNVFTARYKVQNSELTAFVSACADDTGAAGLVRAYRDFLLANGGKAIPGSAGAGERVQIMGGTEVIFSEGRFLAGIHSAPPDAQLEPLVHRLGQHLAEVAKAAGPSIPNHP
jgi:Family of unknown function (DUF6599)